MVEITIAIITAGLSLIGTALGTFSGYRLISYRVEQLEKKVGEHNNFAQRLPVLEEQIKHMDQRIVNLERKKSQ